MRLHATVARYCAARISGAAASTDVRAEHDAWMRSQDIVNPEAMVAMLLPGCS